jgi:Tfp pilus assembly pilus retraction ATPase PilT
MIMRQRKPLVPSIEALGLEPVFHEVIQEQNGITFIPDGADNGKSTTLAALLNEVNRARKVHVITLEDPIEFLHQHVNCTFSQRELGQDFFTVAEGLRAALRPARKIILASEIRDCETMEIALTASPLTGLDMICAEIFFWFAGGRRFRLTQIHSQKHGHHLQLSELRPGTRFGSVRCGQSD